MFPSVFTWSTRVRFGLKPAYSWPIFLPFPSLFLPYGSESYGMFPLPCSVALSLYISLGQRCLLKKNTTTTSLHLLGVYPFSRTQLSGITIMGMTHFPHYFETSSIMPPALVAFLFSSSPTHPYTSSLTHSLRNFPQPPFSSFDDSTIACVRWLISSSHVCPYPRVGFLFEFRVKLRPRSSLR